MFAVFLWVYTYNVFVYVHCPQARLEESDNKKKQAEKRLKTCEGRIAEINCLTGGEPTQTTGRASRGCDGS